jgi:hypothetical protein
MSEAVLDHAACRGERLFGLGCFYRPHRGGYGLCGSSLK